MRSMHGIFLLFFLAFHSSFVWSAGCPNATICAECISSTGCGWCGATQTCMEGTVTSPSSGQCIGSWQTTCIECTQQKTCRACDASFDCVWCNVTTDPQNPLGTCHNINFVNSTNCPVKFSHCPCQDYAMCNDCEQVPGCSFCDTGVCSESSSTSCNKVTCDCNNYFSCTSCNDDPACAWCTGTSNCTTQPAQCATEGCENHCARELSCIECTSERGCGWCPSTETCHSIASSVCGNNLQSMCPKYCDKQTDCNLCIDLGLPCEWCAATRSCVDIRYNSNCSSTDSCATEVCPQALTCETCLSSPGCGWCESGSYCTDIFAPKCSLARNCEGYFHNKFSLGSFFGGMATMLGLYLLIGVCAYFYKKKNPPKLYQELPSVNDG